MADGGNIQFYLFGAALRFGLLHSGLFGLSERPELATPLNSYKRLREGIVLSQNDQDPYAGVLFHETPLALKFFTFLFSLMSESCVNLVFIIGDILTAFVLGKVAELIATNLLSKQAKSVKSYHTDAREDLLIKFEDVVFMPYNVQLAYLLNPYLVASCAAKTTTVFANLLLALFLWSALKKKLLPACLFLALATYQSFYPVMLLVPLCLMLLPEPENEESSSSNDVKLTSMTVMTTFAITLGTIYYLSYLVMGNSWTFLYSTLGFTLAVPELTPNMGLFWYFFTEMFEHFRVFFVCTFQINCFVYVYPLASRLKNQPFLLSLSLIALTAIFKSYPSYGDVGFYIALLPTVSYLFPYMKQSFIVANTLVATTILGPVLYQLWIYNGSANANFFFAITLVFSTAQIFLVTDLLFAHVKREFYLISGFKAIKPNDQGGPQILLQ